MRLRPRAANRPVRIDAARLTEARRGRARGPDMEALQEDAECAIVANDGAALRDAIRRGADVNGMVPCTNAGTGARGIFPLLFMATARGLAGICEILLAEGADTNIGSTDNGSLPLHCAAYHGYTACLRVLLRAGADANSRANDADAAPLHIACLKGRLHAVKLLIAAGAHKEARDDEHRTPLRLAILEGHREVSLTLLRAGAAIKGLRSAEIQPKNSALHDYMMNIIDTGGWDAKVERHRRPLMSILSNLALPHDALVVVLSFWSPPGGR